MLCTNQAALQTADCRRDPVEVWLKGTLMLSAFNKHLSNPTNSTLLTSYKLRSSFLYRIHCVTPSHNQSAHSFFLKLKSQSFRGARILWHLHNILADSCYAFIHQFIHLSAHEYKCDGWPVISDLTPLWVIQPLRLMQCFLMHIHQPNKEISSDEHQRKVLPLN